jgi:hypothetical protein
MHAAAAAAPQPRFTILDRKSARRWRPGGLQVRRCRRDNHTTSFKLVPLHHGADRGHEYGRRTGGMATCVTSDWCLRDHVPSTFDATAAQLA